MHFRAGRRKQIHIHVAGKRFETLLTCIAVVSFREREEGENARAPEAMAASKLGREKALAVDERKKENSSSARTPLAIVKRRNDCHAGSALF